MSRKWFVLFCLVCYCFSATASYTVVMVSGKVYRCEEKYTISSDGLIEFKTLEGPELAVPKDQIDWYQTARMNGEEPPLDLRIKKKAEDLGQMFESGPSEPSETIMTTGWIIWWFGFFIALIGGLWLLFLAFSEDVFWGLAVFCIPLVSLIFVVLHWRDAWKPFLTQIIGGLIMGAGLMLGGGFNFFEWFYYRIF